MVAIFTHNGSDFSIRQTRIGNRFAIFGITGFPGITGIYRITGIPSFCGLRRNNSRRYERTIPVHRIHPLRRVRKRLQIVGFNGESWRRQQSHKRRTVGMVADHVQQGEHIPHFRTFQQGRLPHDQRGQPGLLERFRVFRHGSFGSEQHRHMRAIVFRAMVEITRRGRMQGDRMFDETHDRVDFLAECGESEHANRAFGGFFDVGERRHVNFAHQRAAEASGWQAQRFGEIVRRFEHHARITPRHRQCERFSVGIHAEIVLQHTECARTCASPCVDRLEGVTDRVDRAAMRIVSMEQRAQQRGLRGGGVLVFV